MIVLILYTVQFPFRSVRFNIPNAANVTLPLKHQQNVNNLRYQPHSSLVLSLDLNRICTMASEQVINILICLNCLNITDTLQPLKKSSDHAQQIIYVIEYQTQFFLYEPAQVTLLCLIPESKNSSQLAHSENAIMKHRDPNWGVIDMLLHYWSFSLALTNSFSGSLLLKLESMTSCVDGVNESCISGLTKEIPSKRNGKKLPTCRL